MLVGIALLLTAAIVIVLFIPLASCPQCRGLTWIDVSLPARMDLRNAAFPYVNCECCHSRGKVSLFRKWRASTGP